MEANSESRPAYRSLWVWLLLAWAASAADRTIAGPVFSYIISNNLPIIQGVEHPYAVSGLVVGSLFFAGYMLTQFPGGYLGDKFGHRSRRHNPDWADDGHCRFGSFSRDHWARGRHFLFQRSQRNRGTNSFRKTKLWYGGCHNRVGDRNHDRHNYNAVPD